MTASGNGAHGSRGDALQEKAGTAAEPVPAREVRIAITNCTIARTLGALGEKWTFLILRDAFRGARRFEEFLSQTDIPRQVLSNRLSALTEQGILSKQMYREPGKRGRAEYVLTEKGLDTFPILAAMRQWGDRYEADAGGPPMASLHRDCGATVSVDMRCSEGHAVNAPHDVVHRLEPAARTRATR